VKLSFSTLACPDWSMPQIIAIASTAGYDGIELRFVENEDSFWKLPAFCGAQLAATKQALSDHGLAISCVDTSCRFHSPDAQERARWLEEGERLADLAASLNAPGIRVFGEKIQAGADWSSTRAWIADSIRTLGERVAAGGIEVWLETHGDFASASATAEILAESRSLKVGAVWDPANCFLESGERPEAGASLLGPLIRHVHIKDLRQNSQGWKPALTGDGDFPLPEVLSALRRLDYQHFASFEWEKKWHPEIADAKIALPHFTRWFQENWKP
jgi:sugar phosphate isomerase/epimerase